MNKMCHNKPNSTEAREANCVQINVKVTELILTPLTCAAVINEIIKCLIYQKSQIPYPHSWLKSVVNRKRKDSGNEAKPVNLTVERHYHDVSSAYDALEKLMQNVTAEFRKYGDDIRQVLILFGSTVYSPKEVYTIRVDGLAKGHLEDNHLYTNSRNLHKILRNIVLAQEWTSAMESSIPPTNMYVLLQKQLNCNQSGDDVFFVPNKQYSLPSRTKNIIINLSYADNVQHNCCDNLLIFEDLPDVGGSEGSESNDLKVNCDCACSSCNLLWFQANVALRGFKKCFIKDVSATELW